MKEAMNTNAFQSAALVPELQPIKNVQVNIPHRNDISKSSS